MINNTKWKSTIIALLCVSALSACDDSNPDDSTSSLPLLEPIPAPIDTIIQIDFDFNDGTNGWLAGFSDYPVNSDADFNLSAVHAQLPEPLATYSGFSLSGTNRSDDLFMFIKKGFTGFEKDSLYQFQFEITFASNGSNCPGIGGSPGTSVYVKAGAMVIEPQAIVAGTDYIMNIDKGDQINSGEHAIQIGSFTNSEDCLENNFYQLVTLNNDNHTIPFTVSTDSTGTLWFLFATDSGFEGGTNIYYISGSITVTKIPN